MTKCPEPRRDDCANAELRAFEDRFRVAVNCANYVVFEIDLDTRTVSFFNNTKQIGGFEASDFRNVADWVAAIHPEDRDRVVATWYDCWNRNQPFAAEYRIVLPGGVLRYWSVRGQRFADGGGHLRVVGVIEDITERKHAEEQLRLSEERFRIAAQSASDVIFEWDLAGGDVRLFTRGAPEGAALTTHRLRAMLHPDDIWRLTRAVERNLADGSPIHEEVRATRQPGKTSYWLVRGQVLHAAAKSRRLVGVATNVTGRKRAERVLRVSRERFRIAAESTSDVIFEMDVASGRIRSYEPQDPDIGLTLAGRREGWMALVHPEDRDRVLAEYHQHLETGEPFASEYRVLGRDGNVRYWSTRGRTYIDGEGQATLVAAASDITRRKLAQEELRLSEERFRTAAETASDLVYETDLRAGVSELYGRFPAEFGFAREELTGHRHPWTRVIHTEDADRVERAHAAHLASGEPFQAEYRVVTSAGEVRWWSHRATAMRDAAGLSVREIGAVTDITGRKRAEEALRASEERFRIVAHNASDMIFEWRLADDVIEYFGGDSDELPRRFSDWSRLLHPEDRDRVLAALVDHFHTPGPITLEYRVVLRGGVRHILTRASALFDERGRAYKSVGMFNDITDRKRAEEALHRLAAIVRSSEDAILSCNAGFQIVSWNRAAERLFGYRFEEVAGRSIQIIVPPEQREASEALMNRIGAGQSIQEAEAVRMHKDGTRIPVALTISPILDSHDRIVGFSATVRDISARKRAEAVLRESEERFRRLFEDSPVGIVLSSPDGHVLKANAAMCQMLGYDEAELIGHAGSEFTCPDDCEATEALFHSLLRGENPEALEKRYVRKNGQIVWASVKLSLLRDASGEPRYVVCIIQDITQQKRVQNLLSYRAMHDLLTGLPNRRLVEDRLAQEIRRACRDHTQVALFYIDLDRFKLVNDTLGHVLGDALLRQVAYRLHNCKRAADTLARLGGDEFLLLAVVPDQAAARAIAERLADAFARHFHVRGHDLFIGASIGISLYPSDGTDITTLQRNADSAMYAAKRRGLHSFQFFSPELGAAALERLQLENDLRRAIDRGEFELHYQPLFDLKTNRVVAYEALLRWHHPERGLVPPSKFIPIAEETGLIIRIGRWVLEQACRMAMLRLQHGLEPVRFGVNVSVFQFAQPDFVTGVADVLRASGMDPHWLELEVTESIFMQDVADSARKITELRQSGISISIDDFGTGYSSFSYLQRLPIDALKIDRSFVQDIGTLPNVISLLRAMASLAKSLGMRVVVEGIETEEQLRAVREIGCDEAQGYLFGMPAPAGKTALERLSERLSIPADPVDPDPEVQLPLAELEQ